MKCLILAAGKGTRLADKGLPKPLVSVLGKPIIERVIHAAREAGVTEFLVVTGYEGKRVSSFLSQLKEREALSLVTIQNEQWEEENGVSVLCAEEYLREPFLLTMCDHLLPSSFYQKILETDLGEDEVILSVDTELGKFTNEDLEEATKVQMQGGRVSRIGKRLPSFNGIDTGLFLCSPVIFRALRSAQEKGDTTLSGGIQILASEGRVRALTCPSGLWLDVDDVKSLRRAEKQLLRGLRKTTDGPISRYINRPLSFMITRALVETNLTPNRISLLSFLVAVLAGFTFAIKGYVALIIGGLLTQFASILDGCDGEVARLKYETSEFGGWFDSVLDRYADAIILFGLTMHLLWSGSAIGPLAAGYFSVTGSLINSYTAHKYDKYLRVKYEGQAVAFRLGRDMRLFIIFLGGLLNRAFATLILLALLMNLENIRRILVLYGMRSKKQY